MAAAQTYEPIATNTLSSATNTVTFSSISQSYTDIILVCVGVTANTTDAIDVRVGNGSLDTASNYSMTQVLGNGSAAQSYYQQGTSFTNMGIVTSGKMQSTIIQFMNYSNTSTYKTILGRSNVNDSGFKRVAATVGLWRSTSAINTISLRLDNASYNFAVGFTFTLWGIKAA
jgi:hypothetical protein